MEEKRKYKGLWIPKELLYSPKLTVNERLLLAEIDSLDSDEHGCFATNDHFSKRFSLNKKSVSRVINNLVKKGYIASEVSKVRGKNGGYERKIKIKTENFEKLLKEDVTPILSTGDSLSTPKGTAYPRKSGYLSAQEWIGQRVYKDREYKENTIESTPTNGWFDIFWHLYPRKEGKKRAKEIFKKIKPDKATMVRIIKAVEAHKNTKQWLKDGGQYIPSAANWLAGERWNDEPNNHADRVADQKCFVCKSEFVTRKIQTGRGEKYLCQQCRLSLAAAPEFMARGGIVIPKDRLEPSQIIAMIRGTK
jgi:DNA-binding MarR family transcriptional regulator